jgi:hypothetical protein
MAKKGNLFIKKQYYFHILKIRDLFPCFFFCQNDRKLPF